MMKFEAVVDGINRYLDREIYINLNQAQELVARVVVGRINQNVNILKANLMSNGIVKTTGFIDSDGLVDVDALLDSVRKVIEEKGSVQIAVPMIGKLTFVPSDVEVLRDYIGG